MCSTCGCSSSDSISYSGFNLESTSQHHHHHHHGESEVIELEQNILSKNNEIADHNREHFRSLGTAAFNLVSSPGSGKTTLLEATLLSMGPQSRCYVIEGDQQTNRDAERIAKCKAPVVQINTGKACHLDASMIHRALHQMEMQPDGILFIENVGNLVCPALFDLGESKRVVIISVTEGDDKPIKYPEMFQSSDICLINKIDLLPYVPFSVDRFKEYARMVKPEMEFIELSALTGEGLGFWLDWIKTEERISV